MRLTFFAFFVILLFACSQKTGSKVIAPSEKEPSISYAEEIDNLRTERVSRLTKPTGWLTLIGLHWMKEGMNTIGGGQDNDIIFPRTETETIGAYQLNGDEVFFGKVEGVEVLHEGNEYMGGPVDLGYPFEVVNHGSLYWHILKRGDKYGVRLKDTLAESRLNFEGIPYYTTDRKYRFNADVATTNDSMMITNVLGMQKKYPIAAYLNFNVAEKMYSLAALDEGTDHYFVIMSDETTSAETYGGGRFLYPKKPCDTCRQKTVVDFNLAVNPPCAFTDFASCPLPPERNHLDFYVRAGEKTMPGH